MGVLLSKYLHSQSHDMKQSMWIVDPQGVGGGVERWGGGEDT
jgi:hypothetical protein